jgi:phage terminase large subunit
MSLPQYQIVEAPEQTKGGVTLRGAVREFWRCRDHEVILVGPAETGKTFGGLHKLDALMWKYPGAQAALVRKFAVTMPGTVCQTFAKVANMEAVKILGGTSPERYIYPNGSQVWIGGMDNPSKVLGGERDFIYVNQAEELTLEDWETLLTRATGRAANSPYAQLFGDCNPAGTRHWIRSRSGLTRLNSVHRDNPTLYDDAGNLTDRGKVTMETLNNLSGVRRQRLLEGQWATAEGVVYDGFSVATHVKQRPISEMVEWFIACDEGYTNPAVLLLIGRDSDGRWHIAREFYKRGVLQDVVVEKTRTWQDAYRVSMVAVDAAAAGLIADMQNAGIRAQGAKGRVLDGIQAIQNRLKVQGDGLPRLTVDPLCTEVINEFENYVWKPSKDEPIKEHDHSLDALRYLDNALAGAVASLPDAQPEQSSKWLENSGPSDTDTEQQSWTRRF